MNLAFKNVVLFYCNILGPIRGTEKFIGESGFYDTVMISFFNKEFDLAFVV